MKIIPKSNHKYHAKKVEYNGLTFDSQLEYKRYLFLLDAQQRGQIANLRLQVKYTLIPAQYQTLQRFGKRGQPLTPKRVCLEKESAYFADFVYYVKHHDTLIDDRWETLVVEDTKSKATRTEVYKLKRKLMLDKYGIRIREVSKASDPVADFNQ